MIALGASRYTEDTAAQTLTEHLDDLEQQWILLAEMGQWEAALTVAQILVELAPERPVGWIWQARSLYALNRTQEAWRSLIPVAATFSKVAVIPYDLSRYAYRLGKLHEACQWLDGAFQVGDREIFCLLAADDPVFAPLWTFVESDQTKPSSNPVRRRVGKAKTI